MRAGVAGLVVAGLVLAGCGSAGPPEREPAAVKVAPSPSKVTGEPMDPADLGPETESPVVFGQPVRFSDGVTVEVPAITSARVDEFAVGDGDSKAGDELTVFAVRITNRGDQSFDASFTQVSVSYGPAGEQAEAVQQGRLGDGFGGVVLPGKAMTARWGFVVPPADRGNVTLQVDLGDPGVRGPAVFSGPAQAG